MNWLAYSASASTPHGGRPFEALEPLRQAVRTCFGAFGAAVAGGLKLRKTTAASSTQMTSSAS
jgi:hypothetical protein